MYSKLNLNELFVIEIHCNICTSISLKINKWLIHLIVQMNTNLVFGYHFRNDDRLVLEHVVVLETVLMVDISERVWDTMVLPLL